MLKGNDEQALQEVESPQFVPGSPDGPADNDLTYNPPGKEKLDAAARSEHAPGAETPSPELPSETEGKPTPPSASSGESRKPFRRRHPIAVMIGSVLFVLALAGGYVHWSYASHFQSTDDAFIAARQSSLAPKVSGYITAVPVTDNQHVKAGDVIARIDDRDYRTALEQAKAQVAAAQASIENIDARLDVQQAQIAANQAQVEQPQAALVCAEQPAARYEHLRQTGYGTVQNAQQYTSQLHQQQAALASAQPPVKLAQRQLKTLKPHPNSAAPPHAQT